MNVSGLSKKEYFFQGFEQFEIPPETYQSNSSASSFIKQRIHDNKIDEFFWTDVEAPHKRTSWLAAAGSLVGSFVPVILFAKKEYPELKLQSFKNIMKFLGIEYDLSRILVVGLSSALGGLAGGLLDRKEKRKLDKIEEATYQTMNITFPAVLVSGGLELCKKNKKLNNSFAKLAITALGIFSGASLAVTFANKIDGKLFDKYNDDPDRKFKAKDFIVHIDDVIGALVLAKMPFADKLHAEKILPLIYAWSGYHVGDY